MFCSRQYLSIDPIATIATPTNRPQTAHKLKKIVDMNVDISETIKARELGSQIQIP